MVDFCVTILILKMEGKKQQFWHIMLYCFKKGKKPTETQKICAVYGEVAVTDHSKLSGLLSFTLEISHWTMLQSGRPMEVESE